MEAVKEAVWIRNFLITLGVVQGASNPMDVYCDNNGAIAQAKEPRQHQKNKHIRMRYHQIREFVEDGSVMICKIHTDSNVGPLTILSRSPCMKRTQEQLVLDIF